MSNSTRMRPTRDSKTYSFLLCLTLVLALQACIRTPTITQKVDVANAYAPVQRPAGVQVVPIKVGVYYGPEFRDFVHQDYTTGRNKLEIPVGAASRNHFDKVFATLFSRAIEIDDRPPYGNAKYGGDTSNLSAVVEVRIEDFAYNWRPMSTGPFTASVTYRFILYSPSGNTVSSWTVSGSDTAKLGFTEHALTFTGERTDKAMRVASDKFMLEFQIRPEIERWLAIASDPASPSSSLAAAPAGGDVPTKSGDPLKDITIEAAIYSQHGTEAMPYHSTGVRSQILTAIVNVKNDGTRSILVRPSDITLSPREGRRLHPVSPNRVAKRVYLAPEYEDSEAVGTLINPALGALLTLGEGSDKDSEIIRITEFFKSNQLKDVTVGPSESVSGWVYFEALGVDGKFDEAELRVRVGAAESFQNYDATLMVGRGMATTSHLMAASFGAAALASSKRRSGQEQSPATKQKVNPAPATEGPQRITSAQELLDLLSNTTGSGKSERGTVFAVYNRRDGRMVARTAKGSVDEGVWEITPDGRYCRQWNNWREGARDCFYVFRLDDGRFRFKGIDKPYDSTVSMTPGDSRGLSRRMSTAEGAPLVAAAAVATGASGQARAMSASRQQTSQPQTPGVAAAASAAAVSGPTSESKTQTGPLRVAILPFARPRYRGTNSQAEWDLKNFSRDYVNRRRDLTLSPPNHALEQEPDSLWEGGAVRQVPKEEQIYSMSNQLNADAAFTYYFAPRSADSYASDLYIVDVYVFDLEYQRMYHGSGDERDFKEVHAKLFDQLMADRERVGAPRVTGAAAVVASTSSAQSASVSASPITRPEPDEDLRAVAGLEEGQLTEAEVRQYLTGNTLSGRTESFIDFHIYYGRDGKMSGKAKATRYDAGRWQVLHNGWYCRQWDRWLNGTRECYKVFSAGGNRLHFRGVHSDHSSTHTIRHGDPENLKGKI